MDRRRLLAAMAGSAAAAPLNPRATRANTATPAAKLDGSARNRPVPLGINKRIGAWSLMVLSSHIVAVPTITINIEAVYHGEDPRQIFQDLDFNLIGQDKHLHTLFDGTSDNDASHQLFDMVVNGAHLEGKISIAMPAEDRSRADRVLVAVRYRSSYVYFSLNPTLRPG